MHVGDTIIALATGWAVSPRALVRLSGPSVPVLLRDCFAPSVEWPDRARVIAARLQLPAQGDSNPRSSWLPLPTLIAAYPAPRSYTGEHSAELIVPGNPALIERVLKVFMAHEGVREASPGEFSARAYLNGRLTLAQAEGVAATIAARNEDELAAARRVMHGETGLEHARRVDELAMLLALVEAGIDFTDQEDVIPIAPSALYDKVHALADELRVELGAKRGTERSSGDPVVVLVGAPNAGKSTLFNALLGRRRSVVSPVAGTTRDVISEELDLSDVAPGLRVRLTDLAGLDESVFARAGESTLAGIDVAAQRRAREAIEQADVVVLCDPSGAFRTLGASPAAHQVVIRVRTKGDLLRGADANGAAGHRESSAGEGNDAGSITETALAVCALDGWNLNPLRRAIADAAWRDRASASMSVLPRHRRAIEAALGGLDDALAALEPSRAARSLSSPELIAGSLRVALDSLTELSGRVSPDDVIGRIFATFCIGK